MISADLLVLWALADAAVLILALVRAPAVAAIVHLRQPPPHHGSPAHAKIAIVALWLPTIGVALRFVVAVVTPWPLNRPHLPCQAPVCCVREARDGRQAAIWLNPIQAAPNRHSVEWRERENGRKKINSIFKANMYKLRLFFCMVCVFFFFLGCVWFGCSASSGINVQYSKSKSLCVLFVNLFIGWLERQQACGGSFPLFSSV